MDETLLRSYQRFNHGLFDSADLRALAEEVSGQDLETFFAHWVHGDARLDYAITRTPGLLRLKKDGDPYANVGHMDAAAFLAQCNAMDEDPKDEKFSKIHDRHKVYTNDDHPFFQRWEMVANASTIRQVLDEHAASWPRAKELLLGSRGPVRNLHPVLCGMCRWSEQCAIEFQGGTPEPLETRQTLPVLDGDSFKDISVEELA